MALGVTSLVALLVVALLAVDAVLRDRAWRRRGEGPGRRRPPETD